MPSRLEDAKTILAALGMPPAQQNTNATYTLVALAAVGPSTKWAAASAPQRTIHALLQFLANRWKKTYAENTRETIRRRAIHQFVQGGILVRNPAEPGLATNSPRTHYALTGEALAVLRSFGTPSFDGLAADFRKAQQGGLAERYAKKRHAERVEVQLPDGRTFPLSPGAHNKLQAAIVAELLPRYAPGARVLYLGDTDHKMLVLDADGMAKLGIPVTKHDKLPDVVAADDERSWLFLIEAVTSHGPVSAKRQAELEAALGECPYGRVYVSAFPTFREFKKHAHDIAWETEVWIAEAAEHLLHYNGERFLGPRP